MPSSASIWAPGTPIERKLRGKASLSPRKPPEPEKFVYTRYFARKGCSNHFQISRRRPRRRRILPKVSFGPPNVMSKAGQHRLPGGRDAEGQGGQGPGCISDLRFESRVTLHMGMHILGYELTGGKKCRRISSPDWELFRKVTSERGASRRGAAFGRFPRKISLFCEFLRESRKTPSPAT